MGALKRIFYSLFYLSVHGTARPGRPGQKENRGVHFDGNTVHYLCNSAFCALRRGTPLHAAGA